LYFVYLNTGFSYDITNVQDLKSLIQMNDDNLSPNVKEYD